jgi:hypothetical protein
VILEQVSNGLAVRMAVMSMCMGAQSLAASSSPGIGRRQIAGGLQMFTDQSMAEW